MKREFFTPLPMWIATFFSSTLLYATENTNVTKSKDWIVLPYVFSTDSTGFSGGIGAIKQGLLQPQTTLVASVFGGIPQKITIDSLEKEKSFYGGFLSFSNLKLPYTNRTFFSFMGIKSYFPKEIYYLDGSNNSKQKDVFNTSGNSDFFNTNFRYVLPLAEGLDNPEGLYTLHDGFAVNRKGYGNGSPFVTGRTSIGLKTFYQSNTSETWTSQQIHQTSTHTPQWNTNGLRFYLEHDNTDFDLNPSRGYHFMLQYSNDFGKGDSLQSWNFLSFKYNKYFNLDTFSFTKQNVLALSLWTGYSFSWDSNKEVFQDIDAHRPPLWEGGRLGGFNRLRAYDNNRFSDKAVFYATAEYRTILKYNPLKHNALIPVAIDWFQVVAFAEMGRVHDHYDFDLLSDMKYDIGLSLRAMVAQLPVRFDVAYGEEGANMWVMINQPFDF